MAKPTKRVYVVDDSPIVRNRLIRLISDIPGTTIVGEADSALEAVQRINAAAPDLVILDISMPGGSGMYVLENLKKHAPKLPVIMLSNFTHDQYRDKCRELGADYFFDKSTEFDQVTRVIEEMQPRGAADAQGRG